MKDIIWLSPSLAAGAIAARLVVFFERRPQMRSRRGRGTCRGHNEAMHYRLPDTRRDPPVRLCWPTRVYRRRGRRKA
jgi:hypothetical protein